MTRPCRSEALEHRQERGCARGTQPFENLAEGRLGAEGNDELVLRETPWPVEHIPTTHDVKRMEEPCDRLQPSGATAGSLSKPHLVERGQGERAYEERREAPLAR